MTQWLQCNYSSSYLAFSFFHDVTCNKQYAMEEVVIEKELPLCSSQIRQYFVVVVVVVFFFLFFSPDQLHKPALLLQGHSRVHLSLKCHVYKSKLL